MGSGYKRTDLRVKAQAMFDDAELLLANQRYSNAYHLAGYAVEIGLKACIAAQVTQDTIPDKDLLRHVLQHDFKALVGLAGLRQALELQETADPTFHAFWGIASDWSPDVRYSETDVTSAQLLVRAVGDPVSGVLQWIKRFW